MAKDRVVSHLACTECKMRNYTQVVTKKRKLVLWHLKSFAQRAARIFA